MATSRVALGIIPTRQGMSVGWGDTCMYYLADPKNLVMEANDSNNEGIVYFRVKNGRIRILR